MRESKKRSNIIPFEIGRERYDKFKDAIKKQETSVTENLIGYMDSVIQAEQKKEEAPDRIPILRELPNIEVNNNLQLTLYSFMDTEPEDLQILDNDKLESFSNHCLLMRVESIKVKNKRLGVSRNSRWHLKIER